MSKVLIIGASGHARVCLEILEAAGRDVLGFFDDDPNLQGVFLHGYPIFGRISDSAPILADKSLEYFVAIGNNHDRKKIASMVQQHCNHGPINAIHPLTVISPRIQMGMGNFIAPGVIINTGTLLGDYVILNTGATIDHDNIIHSYAQISPGCNLAGHVTIEEGAFIGTGAIIIPGKTIGAYATIGAGAVVIDDIPAHCTAVGVPARIIRQNHSSHFKVAMYAE
ncbi:acetyltransferase [Desulfobacca acetoxidans]|uniref:Sugar O-acyltransferase, sialic acid O-acetyltransferase NeuD family n=1 Tax=Desulfobacca acetoxidans (strain ATCC 700848 / DSM 11109 / ASRB2) TaxID=880072 RepID=F2NEE4_DESAR|nr:acetyltransferase [Desulfobacca acetoxidans]AEB08134.1 sugar O-acyltransferase, sialic acid O-acetyltransferase NeuD family [Desulfobacca acetoxidans DSM 11109]